MKKTVVIDIVGLSAHLIGDQTPFLQEYLKGRHVQSIVPMLPAVTTSVQSTYVTGKWPSETGIVGNGWYDHQDSEIKFWKQSNKLVAGEKIWERAKKVDPSFTCSKMFWWYNMYSSADFSATPRPQYLADGRKMPDCYTQPAGLRDELQKELGQFPLFQFWGPGANIKSTQWIADASVFTDRRYDPTLTLIYLPHLDYCLQKFGLDFELIGKELTEIDQVVKGLVDYYTKKKANIILLSEYGISPVSRPVHFNRLLRKKGLLGIREERGLELLDAGASKAFAVSDHQVAHIYVNDPLVMEEVKRLAEATQGVSLVLDKAQQKKHHINHERSGDLVLIADEHSWFTYYFWLDDVKAPDYARAVDIHKKPGYDPLEMFMSSKLRAGYKLLRKKMGFRYVMDVIPLDANLIRGSHGSPFVDKKYHPILVTDKKVSDSSVPATSVHDIIWQSLTN
ncbi:MULTISPECIES: alkaline phosphatase family protein [unclassified Imperialibacter]|uniref:alkaline phosphatase family protein n=1 Tax=unclassified Imperialibacter TaxID=2629706 RepID=UPI0012572DC0|nr:MULTISPECIES: nucleotide pyrophosphatase/phosphodiesterase family protein [unclassified Imperialibacter]CAD5266198.1 Predicted pyrophosphatase or phosphodiesterase, AlkP superfamily [Imperialibacter sp. 75]CAD5292336.1 Predicted pyrophosphatase or phosphodiesterase, AlkP superfamily [Imperialibacter sp. 89]VVT17723.1 Predicted pyrophosphatase or phosphodiesterase, AlkP superfamily [Imperialibacter sp. EC-SDR9]